jgi:hypothetical protein
MDRPGIDGLMRTLARAWSTGDARTAADCFTDDIVYVEPPDRQRYVGRDAVFELSGGDDPPAMSMTWHHLAFDPEQQIGFGEYTFRGRASTTGSWSCRFAGTGSPGGASTSTPTTRTGTGSSATAVSTASPLAYPGAFQGRRRGHHARTLRL